MYVIFVIINLLYKISIEYNGEQWKIDLIEKMIKFDPEKRLPFSEIVKRLADQSNPSFLQATLSSKYCSFQYFKLHVLLIAHESSVDSIVSCENVKILYLYLL